MSHIQGNSHPVGTTEHLDYIRIDVSSGGSLTQITVVTHHYLQGINLPQQVNTYHLNPSTGQRDLAALLSATRRTTLQGILTSLANATELADTPTDPAPPLPNRTT